MLLGIFGKSYDWDQEIEGTLKDRWKKFNKDLPNISLISIKRWIGLTKGNKIQLHGFCDASEKGYGAVIYSKTKINGEIKIELLTSKSRVAPVKVITIPRLELCAANLLVNLLEIIVPLFNKLDLKIFCWSDSQTILHWLSKPSTSLKTYVANRVSNIQSKGENLNIKWNWVAGIENPADLISRGTSVLELKNEEKWWKGPKWLTQNRENWPNQTPPHIDENFNDSESKGQPKVFLLVNIANDELTRGKWFKFNSERQQIFPLLKAYGNWDKLQRVTATIQRAIYNFKNPKEKRKGVISLTELNNASKLLINIICSNKSVCYQLLNKPLVLIN